MKQILIVLGILLVFGCADVPDRNKQFITGGCTEGSGSASENQYVTPDNNAPTISSPSSSGATDVSVSADITVPFSEAMDSSTINSTNITVVDGSGNAVSGVWSYSGITATFNPSSDLSYSTTYTVTVGTGVKDRAGNALGSASSWGFTTQNPYPVSITAGGHHTCALLSDSTVKCWGMNIYGQLGDGTTTERTSPVSVQSLSSVTKIASKNVHTCAVLSDQSARCWGYSSFGQLGDGSSYPTAYKSSPVEPLYDRKFLQISLGNVHTCAIVSDYSAECWGWNLSGQIGNMSTTKVTSPTAVYSLGTNNHPPSVSAIAVGDVHSCAVLSDGTAKCWGDNGYGRLGDGTSTQRTIPTSVLYHNSNTLSVLPSIAALSLGTNHSCALMSDQTVNCWGRNNLGQLGNGTVNNSSIATKLPSLSFVSKIATGYHHNCVILTDKTLKCWGDNYYGQLGNGKSGGSDTNSDATDTYDADIESNTPLQVPSLTNVIEVSCGWHHTCVLLSDRTVKCWGRNLNGQLGNGTTTNSSVPVTVQF